MLYQYAYGRLLAESLGYEYAVTKLPREEWPPGQTRAPPHSDSGWETLTKHFRAAAPNSLGLDAEDTASALDGYGCGNKNDTLAVSDRPTDIRADPNRRPPYEVMAGAVYYRPRCIVSKGYWQDAPLYLRAGAPAKLRRWFGPATHDKVRLSSPSASPRAPPTANPPPPPPPPPPHAGNPEPLAPPPPQGCCSMPGGSAV